MWPDNNEHAVGAQWADESGTHSFFDSKKQPKAENALFPSPGQALLTRSMHFQTSHLLCEAEEPFYYSCLVS